MSVGLGLCALLGGLGLSGGAARSLHRRFGSRQRLLGLVAPLLRRAQRLHGAFGCATRLSGDPLRCLALPIARGPGDRRRRVAGTDPDVLQLALEAAVRDLRAGVGIERRGVQRVAHALEHRRRQLVPLRAEQATRGLGQRVHGFALAIGRLTQAVSVAATGEQLRLRFLEAVARFEQLGDRAALGANQLVDSPGRGGGLGQPGDPFCLLAPALGAQLLRQRDALGDEAIEGEAVEVVRVGHRHKHRKGGKLDQAWLSCEYCGDITMSFSPSHAQDESLDRGAFAAREVHEQQAAQAFAPPPALAVAIALIGLAALVIALGAGGLSTGVRIAAGVVTAAAVVVGVGFVVVQPNESRVLILFGRYAGSLTQARLWWVNPFTIFWRQRISLRVHNFQSERIKVNDSSGNPIEIAAVVVWRVVDTAKAAFDVQDFEQFVTVQSETALRHLANEYPYDDYRPDTISLRGNTVEVSAGLQAELQTRLQTAGIEVLETRLTHLAYAAEIAEVMLRRQQAEAILAARKTMVQGAVGLVQMALAQLADSDLIELDAERKATMVANLMVVLSGDHSPTPVINTGSLYT